MAYAQCNANVGDISDMSAITGHNVLAKANHNYCHTLRQTAGETMLLC